MLYFTKIKIILITIFTLIFLLLTTSNFIKLENNLFNKKIKLGLDLQGGSYLLLEVDNTPVITQKLQSTVSELRKFFKNKNINFSNLKIINDKNIFFTINNNQVDKVKEIFESKDNDINPYYQKYKTHKFDLEVFNN